MLRILANHNTKSNYEHKKYKFIKSSIIIFLTLVLYWNSNNILNIITYNYNYFNNSGIFMKDDLSFNLINRKYFYYHQLKIIQIIYKIQIFDLNKKPIFPSDLALNYNLHIACFIIINNTININSLIAIEEDKYFKCTEFFKLNENIEYGIVVYETDINNNIIKKFFLYNKNKMNIKLNYKDVKNINNFKNNNNNNYIFPGQTNKQNNLIKMNKLKKLYTQKSNYNLKRNSIIEKNQWNFMNIFNEYFCFCIGYKCFNSKINEKCRYYYYLYLIDKNSYIYPKTDYLLMDFIFKKYSSDDAYPIFKEMVNHNLNAHYLTENEEIYKKYCHKKIPCNHIIYVNQKNYTINDEFLEKHFTLILKLKMVLNSVGVDINFINNLFYNIDYITYICICHGISYFKDYLYNIYYGPKNFDKLLIPNSDLLISAAIKYGWKEKDIIKFNLPRWDKYNLDCKLSYKNSNIKINSIFIMFTWRELKENKRISSYYIDNIQNLLQNEQLINNIIKHNLTLYFSLHHGLYQYKKLFTNIKNFEYIEENNIAECLSKTDLLVTDFSSIIFDMIYRRKPYIIYIPDSNDLNINNIYSENTCNIINKFKNKTFPFENIYLDINSTVNKIIYYINNKFELEKKMTVFYNNFNFTKENITFKFIQYISKLKPK